MMSTTRKKKKDRGDLIIMRTKKNEPQFIIDFINAQTNISESLRYLIENYVSEKGIRDVNVDILNKIAYGSNNTHMNYKEVESYQTQSLNELNQNPENNSQLDVETIQNNNSIVSPVDTSSLWQVSPNNEEKKIVELTEVEQHNKKEEIEKKPQEDVHRKEALKKEGDRKPVKERNINFSNW